MTRRTWSNVPLALVGLVLVVVLVLKVAGLGGTGTTIGVLGASLIMIVLSAIYALGLNVVVGSVGLLDLGYATFVALGAYTVSLGLVLTNEEPKPLPAQPISSIVLTREQREAGPGPGGEVVLRERPDLRYDCVSGAGAVLSAQAAGQTTIDARRRTGLTLPLGQRVAHGTKPFHAIPAGYGLLLLLAGAVGAVAGVARGLPTLRLVGDYYAIVTLGFAEIVLLVTKNEEWLTGGAFGIKLSKDDRPALLGSDALYGDQWQYFGVVLAVLLLVLLLLARLERSRLGLAWAAIKADETAARSSGIDVDRHKTVAFAVSGFIGAVGGGLFALKVGTVTPTQFGIDLSILCVSCLVLGGMGSLRGALAGAAILAGLNEGLRFTPDEGWKLGALVAVIALGALGLAWRIGGPRGVAKLALFVLGFAALRWLSLAPDPLVLVQDEARPLIYGVTLILAVRFRPQGLLPPVNERPAPGQDELAALRAAASPLYAIDTGARRERTGSSATMERGHISERLKRLREADAGPPPASGDPILEVRGLGKSFGGLRAVNDLSFDVARGSITALIGPNGAGKTTAFNMITGVIPPTDGKIRLEGVELRGLRPDLVCRLGVARTFQNIRLFEDQRVIDNVKVGLHRRLRAGLGSALLRTRLARLEEAEAERASARFLDFVGLLPRMNDCAGALAYGERRRLEIARALASGPRLLLLDEPAAGMNPQETVELMALIRRVRAAGITVLLIEHDMRLVMEISDMIYVLDHGEEISRGPPAVVRADPKVVHAYLGVPD